MKRLKLLALIPPLVALAACSKPQEAVTEAATAPQAISVTTATPVVRTVPASFDATGTFLAEESSDIAPLVPGRVIATPVDAGDFVKQGQVICELDHRDAQLQLEHAKAQLSQAMAALRQSESRIGLGEGAQFDANLVPEAVAARANFESAQAMAKQAAADAKRYANLVASGDVSQSAYEKARTQQETAEAQANAARQQYEAALNTARQSYQAVETSQASLAAARAQLAQAQKALDDTTVRAPFDGYISARLVSVGEHVALADKLATIVRVGILKLDLNTPEQRSAAVKTGMTVEAKVAAFPDRTFTGKVSAINPSVDPNSRVFILRAIFNNSGGELRPGMFASAKVMLPGGEQAVFVPQSAVQRDKTTDSYQVFTIEGGKAHLNVVVTGEMEGGQIRITSGLDGSETVATSNLTQLYDGAPVQARSGN